MRSHNHADIFLRLSDRHGRRANLCDGAGRGARGQRKKDTFKRGVCARRARRNCRGGIPDICKARAVHIRRERRDVRLRAAVSHDIRRRLVIFDNGDGAQPIHNGAGIFGDRHDHDGDRRGRQHRARPPLHLRFQNGRSGRGAGHDTLAVPLISVRRYIFKA